MDSDAPNGNAPVHLWACDPPIKISLCKAFFCSFPLLSDYKDEKIFLQVQVELSRCERHNHGLFVSLQCTWCSSMCVCISLFLPLVSSEEDLSVIYVCASSAIVHDGHVWLDKRKKTHTCKRASFKFLVLSPSDIQVDLTLSQLYRFTGRNKSPLVCSSLELQCGAFIAIVYFCVHCITCKKQLLFTLDKTIR